MGNAKNVIKISHEARICKPAKPIGIPGTVSPRKSNHSKKKVLDRRSRHMPFHDISLNTSDGHKTSWVRTPRVFIKVSISLVTWASTWRATTMLTIPLEGDNVEGMQRRRCRPESTRILIAGSPSAGRKYHSSLATMILLVRAAVDPYRENKMLDRLKTPPKFLGLLEHGWHRSNDAKEVLVIRRWMSGAEFTSVDRRLIG